MTGSSEASAIEAVGKAEAEGMRQKAAAYKMYGDAALTSLVLEALPKVRQSNILNEQTCLFSSSEWLNFINLSY